MTESEQRAHVKQLLAERLVKKGYSPNRVDDMFTTYISVLHAFNVEEIKDFVNTLLEIAKLEDPNATQN